MATNLPSNTRALLARSAYAPELEEFAVWLGGERYTPFVTHLHLLRLEQVLPQLGNPTCSEGDLHRAFVAVGRGVPSRFHRFHATERAYRRFLLARGRLVKDENEGHHASLCIAYERHLRELRGLSLSSCLHHAITVADFLARGIGAGQELRALTLDDVERYVALRSREVSRHSLQHVVAYLRSFLRYCHDQGEIGRGLDAIETPRTYRGELPPQAQEARSAGQPGTAGTQRLPPATHVRDAAAYARRGSQGHRRSPRPPQPGKHVRLPAAGR